MQLIRLICTLSLIFLPVYPSLTHSLCCLLLRLLIVYLKNIRQETWCITSNPSYKLLMADQRFQGRKRFINFLRTLFSIMSHEVCHSANCSASIYRRACAVLCERQLGKINKHSKIKRPHPSFLLSVFFFSSFPLLCHSQAE